MGLIMFSVSILYSARFAWQNLSIVGLRKTGFFKSVRELLKSSAFQWGILKFLGQCVHSEFFFIMGRRKTPFLKSSAELFKSSPL